MQLNRAEAPAFRQVEDIDFIKPVTIILDNGLKIYVINAGEQELIRIEFIFANINWDPSRPLRSYTANSMMNDGTGKMTGAEIAKYIDFYGAFMQMEHSFDHSSVMLFTLNKHIDRLLPVVNDVLTNSVFPQNELDTFKQNNRQKLVVSLEKNDVLARRKFNEALFGNSAYGYAVHPEDYETLIREDLTGYFREAYQPGGCTVIISGKADEQVISSVNQWFGAGDHVGPAPSKNKFSFDPGPGTTHYIERKDALQSAIRIGKLGVNRTHPDFPGLQVLNTILGGYFGSRLMTNIREDKGYTYGIGSGLASLQQAGYFFIASEVGANVCEATILEIEKEIAILKNERVPEGELDLVKNYMMGSFLGDLENAFSHADKFKNIHFYGLGYDYYDRYIKIVRNITPDEVAQLANRYLDFEGSEKVIVGKS